MPPKKRGRKPKALKEKEAKEAAEAKNTKKEPEKKVPKKRGRKPKKKTPEELEALAKKVPKKRGRKPKGGKILKKEDLMNDITDNMKQNIILHLQCKSSDLDDNKFNIDNKIDYQPNISDPKAFNLTNNKMLNLNYETLGGENTKKPQDENINNPFHKDFISNNSMQNNEILSNNIIIKNNSIAETKTDEGDKRQIHLKQIWDKLNKLQKNLKYNNVSDKRSACFWCTCSFDNPAIHIPKEINEHNILVYGCFCSPECAVAHLKNEHIDTSTRWERYAMLNNIYGKIYNYEKNIKPAPSPYYMLDKYYGNMTIEEYRKILENDTLFMIVDKPMTKILPELCEENNELPNVNNNLLEQKVSSSNTYRLKRTMGKKSKKDSLMTNFMK